MRFGDLRRARPVLAEDHGWSDSTDLRATHAARAAQTAGSSNPQIVNSVGELQTKTEGEVGNIALWTVAGVELPGIQGTRRGVSPRIGPATNDFRRI